MGCTVVLLVYNPRVSGITLENTLIILTAIGISELRCYCSVSGFYQFWLIVEVDTGCLSSHRRARLPGHAFGDNSSCLKFVRTRVVFGRLCQFILVAIEKSRGNDC